MTTSSDSRLAPIGAAAPDFELHSTPDQTVSLADFRGRPVVLAFYPADWSPVCGDQMALYNEMLTRVRSTTPSCSASRSTARGVTRVRGDSQASVPAAGRFRAQGRGARRYGAYRAQDGTSERALFVIDAAGIVRWSYLSPIGVNPGADGISRARSSADSEQRGSAAGAGRSIHEQRHPAAPVGAADHPRRGNAPVILVEVRRQRMSALRPRAPRPAVAPAGAREGSAVRVPELPAHRSASRAEPAAEAAETVAAQAARTRSGRCTISCSRTRTRSSRRPLRHAEAAGGIRALVASDLAKRRDDRSAADFKSGVAKRRERHADLLHQRAAVRRKLGGARGVHRGSARGRRRVAIALVMYREARPSGRVRTDHGRCKRQADGERRARPRRGSRRDRCRRAPRRGAGRSPGRGRVRRTGASTTRRPGGTRSNTYGRNAARCPRRCRRR